MLFTNNEFRCINWTRSSQHCDPKDFVFNPKKISPYLQIPQNFSQNIGIVANWSKNVIRNNTLDAFYFPLDKFGKAPLLKYFFRKQRWTADQFYYVVPLSLPKD